MKKLYLSAVLFLLGTLSLFAQSDNGAIKVLLQDKNTKEPIPFANVVAFKDGVQVGVATTNIDGEAFIKPLAPGKYSVKGVYLGYQPMEIRDVVVGEGKTAYVTLSLSNDDGVKLDEVVVVTYQVPLIDPDTKSGATVTREDYQNLASKDVNSVAATTAGVYQADEGRGLNIRGGRSGAATYFVDGVKVFGTPNLPQQSIEQLNVITGGVPASYGDLTSGAISISTRGPQSKYFGGIELISSQLTDPYGYNSLGFSVGGPIWKKRDTTRRTVLGFFVSGQGTYIKEPAPPYGDIYVLKDSKLEELKTTPFILSPSGTGYIYSSEYITKADMTTQRYRPNSAQRSISINGKIDFAPTANTNISWGNYFEYADGMNSGIAGALMNSNNNSISQSRSFRTNIALTQKFGNAHQDKSKTQSLINNAFFKMNFSYESATGKNQSLQHKDNIFNYGYIGNFDRKFLAEEFALNYTYVPDFEYNGVQRNAYVYTGRTEQPLTFTPGGKNPDSEIYTTYLLSQLNPQLHYIGVIQSLNGLVNGGSPQSIYNMFLNFGSTPGSYGYSQSEQYRGVASFNADIKKHAVTVGFEFDQRISRSFGVASTALWTRMRQIANQHTAELDETNPLLNENLSSLVPYYYYNYLYQSNLQTQFSERLLDKLGLPRNYTGFINTDGLNPDILTLDMFSAEDLLGNTDANNLVAYQGYNHYGKKDKGSINISDFLNKTDENGRPLYPIGSFKPIYASAYIMDKFDFKDIKFLVGLRVDRYDANQPVLKDKYALHDLARVGDLASLDFLPAGFTDNIPGNISKDAAVYVAQNPTGGRSPLSIRGYRDGDKWYNSEGTEISDPTLIAASDGKPVPLYKDVADYDKAMSEGGFTTYKAAIIPQPRLAFSFPISDVANFFAHYDRLMQRPTNSVLNPLDYFYLPSAANLPTVNNPNQRPQETVDYELGFSQILNERKNASLTITSFYREQRNLINQRVVVGAYPKSYIMFDNIDFNTVKGLSFILDFRRTGGSRFNFNYTLQFAEGSGSNTGSGANLASSGQPNLRVLIPLDFDQRHTFVLNYDYRFGAKKDYKGPTYKNKKGKVVNVFENVGLNLTFNLGSGTPYTRWSTAVPTQGGNARSSILGQINGSSKPWTFRTNLRLEKNIPLEWNKDNPDKQKNANLNVYLQVLNLLNTRNILGVYNYTGAADDDGYLTSTQAQAALALANSAAAFSDMYSIRVNNPYNYGQPRQIRIGALFEF